MKKLAYSKMLGYLMMACLCLLMAVMPTLAADNAKDQILNKTVDSITLIDSVGRTVTVPMPVERIIPTDYRTTEALLALGAREMIVGVDTAFHQRMTEFGLEGCAGSLSSCWRGQLRGDFAAQAESDHSAGFRCQLC